MKLNDEHITHPLYMKRVVHYIRGQKYKGQTVDRPHWTKFFFIKLKLDLIFMHAYTRKHDLGVIYMIKVLVHLPPPPFCPFVCAAIA
jgi:hypothetical protein